MYLKEGILVLPVIAYVGTAEGQGLAPPYLHQELPLMHLLVAGIKLGGEGSAAAADR